MQSGRRDSSSKNTSLTTLSVFTFTVHSKRLFLSEVGRPNLVHDSKANDLSQESTVKKKKRKRKNCLVCMN